MEGIIIKIQRGLSIYAAMAAVAEAAARGKLRYENDKAIVICRKNTYRVFKRKRYRKDGIVAERSYKDR